MIGIYAYGENVSVDFSEATSFTIDNVFVNFDDTAKVTGVQRDRFGQLERYRVCRQRRCGMSLPAR